VENQAAMPILATDCSTGDYVGEFFHQIWATDFGSDRKDT